MAEILKIAKDGTLKTQIMYRANLSFAQLNDYLSLLKGAKLLKVNTTEGRAIYKTTSKGVKYLDNLATVKEWLKRSVAHIPICIHSSWPKYLL
jgi:predicted transcriptional regulator